MGSKCSFQTGKKLIFLIMVRNFFDLLFYRAFKISSRTNKTITEWSTIIWISILFSLNVFSIIIYSDFPIMNLKREGFMAIPVVFIILNYFYFLHRDRYLEINKKFDQAKKKYFLFDTFFFLYSLFSFVILFKLLNAKDEYIFFIVILMCVMSLYSYFVGVYSKKRKG